MADLLATIHSVRPAEPFRTFQSWAWPAKWVVPSWTRHPDSWTRAFELLAGPHPAYEPTFLHRDFGHQPALAGRRDQRSRGLGRDLDRAGVARRRARRVEPRRDDRDRAGRRVRGALGRARPGPRPSATGW